MDNQLPDPCLCATLRKATRALTTHYDTLLSPSGLKVTQYSILMNITRSGGITTTELAKALLMDQTTASRNLQLLKKKGYVQETTSPDDQRVKTVTVTAAGRERLEAAMPLWLQAQAEIRLKLGKLGFDVLQQSLMSVID